VLVESDVAAAGMTRVARGADGVLQATQRLEQALGAARATISAAVAELAGLGFEELTLQFGIKLSAEAGALIARTAGEANLTVTAKWGRPAEAPAPAEPPPPTG